MLRIIHLILFQTKAKLEFIYELGFILFLLKKKKKKRLANVGTILAHLNPMLHGMRPLAC
jgi:hypothetical protein